MKEIKKIARNVNKENKSKHKAVGGTERMKVKKNNKTSRLGKIIRKKMIRSKDEESMTKFKNQKSKKKQKKKIGTEKAVKIF